MIARIYAAEIRAEFLKLVRLPAYAIPTIAFPVLFYLFFGILMPQPHAQAPARYLLASYGAFGATGAALFAFGVGVATERGQGWIAVKRASPMPPSAFIVAKAVGSLAFAALIATIMFALAAFAGHVEMRAGQWIALFVVLVAGTLPFCAIGLALGTIVPPNSAAAVVNLIYLPFSFCAGLWVPIAELPHAIRAAAPLLPTYHFGQLALAAVGIGHDATGQHAFALGLWAAVGAGAAVWALARDEGRTYG